MDAPHEGTPRAEEPPVIFFATDKLAGARTAILSGASALLTARAKVEKYRQTDTARAEAAYTDLQQIRAHLISALTNARLALLELEEYQAAKNAALLAKGLAGFDLMSTFYKPVHEVLTAYANGLPDSAGKASARIIGRLMNNVKLGYYPTDPDNIAHILRGIQFPEGVITNLLDPCCGCGKALRQMAQGNNCYTYGVELDETRAAESLTRLHRVGMGSYFYSRISDRAFHLLLLNPPYLSVLHQGGGRTRHEKRFLAESMGHLMVGGLLVYIIPYYRLTPDICRILSDNFSDLSVWRFTVGEFQKFKQAAVLGLRKRRTDDPESTRMLEQCALDPTRLPCVTDIPKGRYALPTEPREVAVFKGEKFNEKELEQQLCRSDSFERLMAKSELDGAEKHPLLPLSIGQIGLVGGSGMINGLVECGTPHIIKGRMIKVRNVETEEKYNSGGKHTGQEIKEVISNKMVFNVLTPNGFKALT